MNKWAQTCKGHKWRYFAFFKTKHRDPVLSKGFDHSLSQMFLCRLNLWSLADFLPRRSPSTFSCQTLVAAFQSGSISILTGCLFLLNIFPVFYSHFPEIEKHEKIPQSRQRGKRADIKFHLPEYCPVMTLRVISCNLSFMK